MARAWGTREIDLTRAEKAACGYRFDLPDGVPPVFVLWARAALDALAEVPMLNSRWTDEAIHLHRAVDVGIEVPTGHGRIVPVIRDAAGLRALRWASFPTRTVPAARSPSASADVMDRLSHARFCMQARPACISSGRSDGWSGSLTMHW